MSPTKLLLPLFVLSVLWRGDLPRTSARRSAAWGQSGLCVLSDLSVRGPRCLLELASRKELRMQVRSIVWFCWGHLAGMASRCAPVSEASGRPASSSHELRKDRTGKFSSKLGC